MFKKFRGQAIRSSSARFLKFGYSFEIALKTLFGVTKMGHMALLVRGICHCSSIIPLSQVNTLLKYSLSSSALLWLSVISIPFLSFRGAIPLEPFNFLFIYSVSQKKVAPLKLFAIFSLRLSIFLLNFVSMLPVYIYTYLPVLVDLSWYLTKWRQFL